MNNRRNYYRMLNVQPDASQEVIRASYRALLQKLKLHPDLGGEQWSASHINRAYNVLKNPEKRAAYDKKLLAQYCIKELSNGGIEMPVAASAIDDSAANQRNYYRVLQVQIDSPDALIQSSYQALKKQALSTQQQQIIDEAYRILADPILKQQYDQLLRQHGHPKAARQCRQPSAGPDSKPQASQPASSSRPKPEQATQTTTAPPPANPRLRSVYQPVILQYCQFCKTPHNHSPGLGDDPMCIDCRSPLYAPPDYLTQQAGRDITRIQRRKTITVYRDWPSPGQKFTLLDLSPSGIKIATNTVLATQSIVKIDADDFNAVGQIIYCESVQNAYHVGLKLLTAKYHKQKGQFFTAQA